jgi:hypothetical protein
MDRMDRWKLAGELNVYQIALLIAGYDPSEFEEDRYDRWPVEVRKRSLAIPQCNKKCGS